MSRNRSVGHDPAFLVPVPLYFGYGTGCVVTRGHVAGGGMSVGACGATVGPLCYHDLALLETYERALAGVVSLNVAEC